MKRSAYIESEGQGSLPKPYQCELDYTNAMQQLMILETKMHAAIVKVPNVRLHLDRANIGFVHSQAVRGGTLLISFTIEQRTVLNDKKSLKFRFRTKEVLRASVDDLAASINFIWLNPDVVEGMYTSPITHMF